MSKITVASLAALVAELTTRLTAVESEVTSLKSLLQTKNASLKTTPLTVSEEKPKKKGNNPTGPSAYNKQVKDYVLAHPDVPYETAQIEVSISNWMTRDGLTRAEAEVKIAELKAKRSKSKKQKETEITSVDDSLPNQITISQPLSLFSPSTQVMEKLQATKKIIDDQTYYVDEHQLAYVIPNGVVDDFIIVGKFNSDTNSVKLSKTGKKYFGIVDTTA
jgi:hypothetical protein